MLLFRLVDSAEAAPGGQACLVRRHPLPTELVLEQRQMGGHLAIELRLGRFRTKQVVEPLKETPRLGHC